MIGLNANTITAFCEFDFNLYGTPEGTPESGSPRIAHVADEESVRVSRQPPTGPSTGSLGGHAAYHSMLSSLTNRSNCRHRVASCR